MLNGFDISNYQSDIQLNRIPFDFCIVQHSFGNYVQPTFYGQINSTLALGKKAGIYHYVTGQAGEIEAFINGFKPYADRAIPALDFERKFNSKWLDFSYLFDFASEIINQTGVRPLLYGSASIYTSLLDVGRQLNCGLWIAQYATDDPTGYQSSPWNESSYNMAIFQYSSTGRLPGYNGDLDLDLFYGDGNVWDLYAKSDKTQPAPKRVISINMDIDENDLKTNQDTLPIGQKIVITNTASDRLYLTSHNGQLCMTDEPMGFFVQKNSDNSISLADPWGNWITVNDKPANGELPSVVRGNGQITQRWMASPYNGGFKLTTAVDKAMNLDLPKDDDFNGAKVQVWSEWANNEVCKNQTWKFQLYSQVESNREANKEAKPAIKDAPKEKSEAEAKTVTKVESKPKAEDTAKVEVKTDKTAIKDDTAKEAKISKPKAEPDSHKGEAKPIGKSDAKITKPVTEGEENVRHGDLDTASNGKKDNKGDKEVNDLKAEKLIGDVADTIEGDIKDGSFDTDSHELTDKVSGMIEEALGKKALNRKTVRIVFIFAILLTLACIVLGALALAHCLPMWVGGLCAMILGGTGIGGHTLGISATTK